MYTHACLVTCDGLKQFAATQEIQSFGPGQLTCKAEPVAFASESDAEAHDEARLLQLRHCRGLHNYQSYSDPILSCSIIYPKRTLPVYFTSLFRRYSTYCFKHIILHLHIAAF